MADYKLMCGNALEILKSGKEKSIQCVITSPPYYGLRSYSGGEAEIGLEKSPQEYVNNLVAVFREVRRMLRDDGVLFLNLGDSYNGFGGPGNQYDNKAAKGYKGEFKKFENPNRSVLGLKPKDLIGIPWMVAFALREDGWFLRQDIIWEKPNCMPESVKDRCTKSHEYIFLLTKDKKYFYDWVAIQEEAIYGGKKISLGEKSFAKRQATGAGISPSGNGLVDEYVVPAYRNKRSVWSVTTKSYRGSHFATFPPDLVEPMVLAGTSEKGACIQCGKPWKRVIQKETSFEGGSGKAGRSSEDANANGKWAGQQYGENIKLGPVIHTETVGWEPTCDCGAETRPCWILDPFCGSGTVGVVALKNGRRFVGIDLNPEYIEMSEKRIQKDVYGK